jgi:pimeloyl-ACP methyl ester carboxylesterase
VFVAVDHQLRKSRRSEGDVTVATAAATSSTPGSMSPSAVMLRLQDGKAPARHLPLSKWKDQPMHATPDGARLMCAFRPLLLLALAACGRGVPSRAASEAWTDRSPHAVRALQVQGATLQVLDWGGTGDGLVFIHGLGDSPHAWDDLAPAFTDRFRVLAYARRGHGQSRPVTGPFDNETLVDDLRQVLDSLGVARAVLAGWSMGGNEIARFAERHPDRTAALVYLESGYDWSDTTVVRLLNTMPFNWTAEAVDLHSLDRFRRWWNGTFWPEGKLSAAAEAEVRDIVQRDAAGQVRVSTDPLLEQLFASVTGYRRDYRRVKAPALAIYSEHFLPPQVPDSSRAAVAAWNDEFRAFQRRSIERLRRESGGPVEIHVLAGVQHMAFPWMEHDTLVALMRGFLAK